MSTGHTPGPWWVAGSAPGEVAPTFPVVRGFTDATQRITVARVGNNNHYSKNSVDHSNARLIAAAPELLDALDAIIKRAENPALSDDTDALLRAARAAIAKATKGTP